MIQSQWAAGMFAAAVPHSDGSSWKLSAMTDNPLMPFSFPKEQLLYCSDKNTILKVKRLNSSERAQLC